MVTIMLTLSGWVNMKTLMAILHNHAVKHFFKA